MSLPNEKHPIRHLFSIQGLTDRAADIEVAVRGRRLFGDQTFIHNHRSGLPCTDVCASLDDVLTEREEQRRQHAVTVADLVADEVGTVLPSGDVVAAELDSEIE